MSGNGTNRSKLHARRNEMPVNSGNACCLSAYSIRWSAQEAEAVVAVTPADMSCLAINFALRFV